MSDSSVFSSGANRVCMSRFSEYFKPAIAGRGGKSNTPPSTVNGEGNTNLTDLDYLSFWAYGSLDPKTIDLLRAGMTTAQTTGEDTLIEINGLEFYLRPFSSAGRGNYHLEFMLERGGFFIGLTGQVDFDEDLKRPNLKLEAKGDAFTIHGSRGVFVALERICGALGFTMRDSKVHRFDLRTDVVGVSMFDFWWGFYEDRYVRSTRKFGIWGNGNLQTGVETLYIGRKKAPVLCRIYDKQKDLARSKDRQGKYRAYVTESEEAITRIEFEVTRDGCQRTLKRFGISSVEDMLGQLGAVADYLVSDWLRLCDKRVDRNNTQLAKTSEIWNRVQSQMKWFSESFYSQPVRPLVSRENVKSDRLITQLVTAAVNVVADRGIDTIEMQEDIIQEIRNALRFELIDVPGFIRKADKKRCEWEKRNAESAFQFFDAVAVDRKPVLVGSVPDDGWWD